MNEHDEDLARKLKAEIKKTERVRNMMPFIYAGFILFFRWLSGEGLSPEIDSETASTTLLLVGLIFLSMEILNVKILMFKSELREIFSQ